MRVAVVGGGAAGIFGAISAATHNPETEITVLESTRQPLDKVRISGGGRCNVTHNCFDPATLVKNYPRGAKELRGPFSRFQPRDTVEWFTQHGVKLKTEPDGRMFPESDQSSTIVDCLLQTAASLGAQLRLDCRVKSIAAVSSNSDSSRFDIEIHPNIVESFDRVLIATGNSPQGYHFAQSLGHTIAPCVPSLFTFKISDPRLENLSGIAFPDIHLELLTETKPKLQQSGPMLITHWGLSGPAVLKLSAWGARVLHDLGYHADLKINFLPNRTESQIYKDLLTFKDHHGKKRVLRENPLPIPNRYWNRIAELSGVSENALWTNLTKDTMKSIVSELTAAKFTISGKGQFKEEFVTCGGVSLKEIDFQTMQSKLCPGLFFAGEILDIDGITGGFNFQNAWTTGWLAGSSAAR